MRLGDVPNRDPVKLSVERKLFTDTIKICAYEIETRLYGYLSAELRHCDAEGRAFVREIMQLTGHLRVTGDTLEVDLPQLSAPRYTQGLQSLCEQLNSLAPTLPETAYRLHFSVRARPIGE
jgi:hypothetical protein